MARDATNDTIIGTIAYSPPNDLITTNLNVDLTNVSGVTSVLVLPAYQGKGVGSRLFHEILTIIKQKHIHAFCLAGGYKKSQGCWIKKLGEPNVVLKDYYEAGLHHMIWYRNINDILS